MMMVVGGGALRWILAGRRRRRRCWPREKEKGNGNENEFWTAEGLRKLKACDCPVLLMKRYFWAEEGWMVPSFDDVWGFHHVSRV